MPAAKKKRTPSVSRKGRKTDKKPQAASKPAALWAAVKARIRGLLARRPHRSFQRTRRRDYVRPLALPGYWSFTNYVRKTLWANKRAFLLLMLIYATLMLALVGIASQDTYKQISDLLHQTSGDLFSGDWGKVQQASLLVLTAATGSYSNPLNDTQMVYAVLIVLMVWLTTVWLLRSFVGGRKPKLRDGLYNAGAPILPTFLVGLVGVVQLLPVAFAVLAFGAGINSGILDGGVEAMLFWLSAGLLTALSLYWLTSTFIALIIVTLPGMYPMRALRAAGDIVIGRRIRILLRLVWLIVFTAVVWLLVMVPIILFDAWLKSVWGAIAWMPAVPFALLLVTTLSIVWIAGYIYLLYRKVVDDDTAPA